MAPWPPSLLCTHLVLLALIFFIILSPFSATAQKNGKISLGSSLTPSSPNSSWISSSSGFAFGFRPVVSGENLFLLAIWFYKTPEKTIVWFAGGGFPVGVGSRLDLTAGGKLSLKDQTGKERWSAEGNGAAYASMLDSGNFVLVGEDGFYGWQSFSAPTDTLLPGQSLQLGSKLISKLTDDDYSSGRFTLRMQLDGELVMYSMAVPTGTLYDPYYTKDSNGRGLKLVFDVSGEVYIALPEEKKIVVIPGGGNSSAKSTFQRATLDPDGVFRRYIYNGGSWKAVDGVPMDICQAVLTSIGSGTCGFNSYCKSQDVTQRVQCFCPPKYSFIDPTREYKGCKPDFAQQSCDKNETGSGFNFVQIVNLDWPLADYELNKPVTAAECEELCLKDCFCAVTIFRDDDGYCWKKKLPLSNGKLGSYVNRLAFIKVPK